MLSFRLYLSAAFAFFSALALASEELAVRCGDLLERASSLVATALFPQDYRNRQPTGPRLRERLAALRAEVAQSGDTERLRLVEARARHIEEVLLRLASYQWFFVANDAGIFPHSLHTHLSMGPVRSEGDDLYSAAVHSKSSDVRSFNDLLVTVLGDLSAFAETGQGNATEWPQWFSELASVPAAAYFEPAYLRLGDLAVALGRAPSAGEIYTVFAVLRLFDRETGRDGIRPALPGNFTENQEFRLGRAFQDDLHFTPAQVERLLTMPLCRGAVPMFDRGRAGADFRGLIEFARAHGNDIRHGNSTTWNPMGDFRRRGFYFGRNNFQHWEEIARALEAAYWVQRYLSDWRRAIAAAAAESRGAPAPRDERERVARWLRGRMPPIPYTELPREWVARAQEIVQANPREYVHARRTRSRRLTQRTVESVQRLMRSERVGRLFLDFLNEYFEFVRGTGLPQASAIQKLVDALAPMTAHWE